MCKMAIATVKSTMRLGLQALAVLAPLIGTNIGYAAAADPEIKIGAKSYVLILFLYDPNKTYHTLRAATYTSDTSCNQSGKNVLATLGTDKNKLQNNSYMCLEADLPY